MKKQSRNQYTIGKQLRKAKGLRKQDPTAQIIQPTEQLAEYIEYLKSRGVVIKDLSIAKFTTKNGLPYIGLITTSLFPTNKIFIRVPVDCLLNTRVAFHGGVRKMFEDHPEYFSKQFHHNWEDHILLAYILYEYGRGKDSEWYHLIRNLPREIDYVIFWDENEIGLLQDKVLEKMIKKTRAIYEKETDDFLKIASQYPDEYSKEILTEENIRWIHIHLVTRCFGKYFEYTTMVPFAQLINHQCSDVYYSMYYKESNPYDTKQVFYDQKELTSEEIDDLHTSDGSYDSEEYEDLDDLFEKEEYNPITAEHRNQNPADVIKIAEDAYAALYHSVNFGDNVSLGFLLETHQGINRILMGKEQTPNHKKVELTQVLSIIGYYLYRMKAVETLCRLTKSYHAGTVYQQKQTKSQQEQETGVPQKGTYYYPDEWEQDKFDEFLMLCSTKDQFQKHSQIFFCYGRLSNRMMLMRYGMTLEYNKYNHIYLHLPIDNFINDYSIFPKILKKYNMPRTKSIKVRRTKLCVEVILFLRGIEWRFKEKLNLIFFAVDLKAELRVIKKAISMFQQQLGVFSGSLEQHEKLLHDSKLGYHEYFSVIYKLEKQRIIQTQIRLLNIVFEILMRLLDGKTDLEEAMLILPELQTPFQMRTNRLMMRDYFDKLFRQ